MGRQVDPEQLDRDENLGPTESSSKEDTDDFSDAGVDQVAEELLLVGVEAGLPAETGGRSDLYPWGIQRAGDSSVGAVNPEDGGVDFDQPEVGGCP